MVAVTRTAPVSPLAPEFDDFLFASVGEDGKGMLLSVISALARLDLDPWQEAADLARLPGAAATRRLASLIAALPDWPSANLDPGTIAARLVARLPRLASSSPRPPAAAPGAGAGVHTALQTLQSQPFRYVLFILMVVALGGLGIAENQRSAARVDNAAAPASHRDIPQVTPPSAGR